MKREQEEQCCKLNVTNNNLDITDKTSEQIIQESQAQALRQRETLQKQKHNEDDYNYLALQMIQQQGYIEYRALGLTKQFNEITGIPFETPFQEQIREVCEIYLLKSQREQIKYKALSLIDALIHNASHLQNEFQQTRGDIVDLLSDSESEMKYGFYDFNDKENINYKLKKEQQNKDNKDLKVEKQVQKEKKNVIVKDLSQYLKCNYTVINRCIIQEDKKFIWGSPKELASAYTDMQRLINYEGQEHDNEILYFASASVLKKLGLIQELKKLKEAKNDVKQIKVPILKKMIQQGCLVQAGQDAVMSLALKMLIDKGYVANLVEYKLEDIIFTLRKEAAADQSNLLPQITNQPDNDIDICYNLRNPHGLWSKDNGQFSSQQQLIWAQHSNLQEGDIVLTSQRISIAQYMFIQQLTIQLPSVQLVEQYYKATLIVDLEVEQNKQRKKTQLFSKSCEVAKDSQRIYVNVLSDEISKKLISDSCFQRLDQLRFTLKIQTKKSLVKTIEQLQVNINAQLLVFNPEQMDCDLIKDVKYILNIQRALNLADIAFYKAVDSLNNNDQSKNKKISTKLQSKNEQQTFFEEDKYIIKKKIKTNSQEQQY